MTIWCDQLSVLFPLGNERILTTFNFCQHMSFSSLFYLPVKHRAWTNSHSLGGTYFFCLVFNLLAHLVFFDDVSKFWVFAQVISGKNGVLASFVFFAFFSTSSKRRHFHYETSLQCVMWLQQKQLMVLTVLQLPFLLKSKWFFSTNLAPAL